ncbi:MAG: histidine kinase [Perlabentimonas sp.]
MQHPVFSNKWGRVIFLAWWGVVIATHCVFLNLLYSVSFEIAIVDSIVWNAQFAILSLGLWYWVRISDIETQNPLSIMLNHIGAVTIMIILLVSSHRFLLKTFYSYNDEYIVFLDSSIAGRVVTGTLLYFLVAAIFYLIIYISNFREKATRESELKALVKEAELNWLKLQLNPHFLFNSLNSISSLTVSSPAKAQDMVNRLSVLLRYSLRQSPDSMVSLKDEVENCRMYLEIEKVRFGSRLNYSLNVPESTQNEKIPAMILQPLFENAIKHSVAQTSEPSSILLKVIKDNGSTSIIVENSLPSHPTSNSGMGVGLENINRRLTLIYGDKNLLVKEKKEGSYIVAITFPRLH